jgi:hypothetical protein
VIYLDFNGATISGTAWNSNGNTITAESFDLDGNPVVLDPGQVWILLKDRTSKVTIE